MSGRHMLRRRKWAIAIALTASGFAQTASAGTRFAIGDEEPVTATVRMDFTIIIPEILSLTIACDLETLDSAATLVTITVPALSKAALAGRASASSLPLARASSNAGTLAVGTLAVDMVEGGMVEGGTLLSENIGQDRPQAASLQPSTDSPDIAQPVAPTDQMQARPWLGTATVSLDTHSAIFLIALP